MKEIRDITRSLSTSVGLAVPSTPIISLWGHAFLAGALLGIMAQFLRQLPGVLMTLGASTAPWVMVGFALAVSASHGASTVRRAILAASGIVAAYLVAWLIWYHLMFVIRESLSLASGWREAAPWLLAAIPSSLILGTLAALSHKSGLIGDACLAAPTAWSLPEALVSSRDGWLHAAAVMAPVVMFVALLIYMAAKKRQVRAITLFWVAIILGALGYALFPTIRGLIRS